MKRRSSGAERRLVGVRVVFVVAWAQGSGAERSALQVARRLVQEEGARVDVLALTNGTGRFRDAMEDSGVSWHPFAFAWPTGRVAKGRELARVAWRLRRLQPDVLLPYCTRPNVICGLVWQSTGARLCVWNQRDVLPSSRFGRSLIGRAARNTPLLLANSRTAGAHVVREFGVPAERIRVIHDSGQLPPPVADRARWRERLGLASTSFVVTMPANLHRFKDHATLLRAWRGVLDTVGQGADVMLLLAGRFAGAENEAKSLAFDLGLARHVRFLGHVTDMSGLLDATDVGVLSSRSESSPNAILECMASGLPVTGTSIPGIRESVTEAQLPFLAPPGDDKALASAILELYSSPRLRSTLGEENRRWIATRQTTGPRAVADVIVSALASRRQVAGTLARLVLASG